MRGNLLLVLLVVGATIGFAIGAIINDPVNRIVDRDRKATVIMLIAFPGELFMNMLKMIVLPLIVASLITAVSTLNPDVAGRIGRRALLSSVGRHFGFDSCDDNPPRCKRRAEHTKRC